MLVNLDFSSYLELLDDCLGVGVLGRHLIVVGKLLLGVFDTSELLVDFL